jgi:hypothetical protein
VSRGPILLLAAALAPASAAADMAVWRFDWQGAGGYSMVGALGVEASLADAALVDDDSVTCFQIEGFRDGAPIGRWALGMLTELTTWELAFSPRSRSFVVYGPEAPMPQAWNMDGWGTDCGPGGFGFNIGNAAQDLCLDGVLVVESQVEPSRPMSAWRHDGYPFAPDACRPTVPISSLEGLVTPAAAAEEEEASR